MNDLRAYKVFLMAARVGSFAGVARQMNIAPAVVTRTVAQLEADLGVQLFVRTTRQISLTGEGAVFAARIEPLVHQLDHLRTELRDANKADEGQLRINAPMSFGEKVLPELLSAFHQSYPRISLQVALTDRHIDVVSADFDMAVRISEPPADKSTIWRKLCEVRRVLVAAPDSPFAALTHPDQLPPQACLAHAADSRAEPWVLTQGKSTVSLSAGQSISANNGDVLAKFARAGQGVALLPVFIVSDYIRRKELVPVLEGWQPPRLWLTLFYPPYKALPPRIATFSDFFEARIPEIVNRVQ
ncbi:MAG: LysR family transcriptional regulator [Paracoccus denitrificans]|nr:MAG: LysR family transcriptional regulator [Paracoccus denitrificans]PZO84304.1 MAG: LysR family transcriptional regulator [Paracoccus denitrificans]